MVIHGRYALGTEIVIEASLVQNGAISKDFKMVLFTIAPVISWLAKSKGKPVVSCLKHAMTDDVNNSSIATSHNQNEYNNGTQYVKERQPYFNANVGEVGNMMNQYSQQSFQYSQMSQFAQYSQQP